MRENPTMKDLPVSERPYEKCIEKGPAFLSDAELLAVILRSGVPGMSAIELATGLLAGPGRDRGLGFLMTVSRRELEAQPGIGPVKASELLAVGELSRRLSRQRTREGLRLSNPGSIANYFMEDMTYLAREELLVAMFDTKNRFVHSEVLSVGTVNSSLASPREIFLSALKHEAVYIVVLHNHPSGDPAPSREDLALTEQLREAGELLQIPLMDHIIIGDHCFTSLRERGLLR